MPNFNTRIKRIKELLESESALRNGYEITEQPGKFLAVEYYRNDGVWALTGASLEELKAGLESSDTDRDDVKVYDLDDSSIVYRPVWVIGTFAQSTRT